MRLLVSVICAAAFLSPPALARSLQIQGVTGYLSEYELTADVSGQLMAGGTEELSGQLSVKHVGLCTHDGPNEMHGQLKIRFMGLTQKIEATLSYEGRDCIYHGSLSESETGFMTCTDKLTLPLKLWTK